MSWSDVARLAGAMAIAASLGGCFQPLYGQAAHPGLVEDMRAIEIAEVNPPIAGIKPNALGLNPELDRDDRVTTSEITTTPTVESQIGAADAATLTIRAKYALTPVDGGEPIIASEAVSSAIYDLSLNRYANLRAARDAEIRLAKSLADEMELRIAAALAGRQGS
jgi:LPS-assembly lipoprotein